jgi:membrane protein involved in colicin uptake
VDILRNPQGQPQRAEVGQLAAFNVKTFNFAIENLDYDSQVTDQIKKQQDITMAVQTSIAQAKQAEQDALTARAKGEANIAQTRAQQEVEKTAAVVQAEKARDVAKLKAEEAKFYEQEKLTRASADAEAARKMITADGALDKKLATYERVQANWAAALATSRQPLVPSTVIGGGSGGGSAGNVQSLLDMLTAKTAKELTLDITPGRPPQ